MVMPLPGGPSDVAACRVCGCTEDNACAGGCWWVQDPSGDLSDLCSACMPSGPCPCEDCAGGWPDLTGYFRPVQTITVRDGLL